MCKLGNFQKVGDPFTTSEVFPDEVGLNLLNCISLDLAMGNLAMASGSGNWSGQRFTLNVEQQPSCSRGEGQTTSRKRQTLNPLFPSFMSACNEKKEWYP